MKPKTPSPQRIAVTLGEPAGIGPDLALLVAQTPLSVELVVIGSKPLLMERAQQLGQNIKLTDFDPNQPTEQKPGQLTVLDVPLRAPVIPGTLNVANSPYVIDTLKKGVGLCKQGDCNALLTLPVHKAILAESGVDFTGHTEYFAKLAGAEDVLMSFYTPQIIVGLVTTHVPLGEVPQHLTAERCEKAITLLHDGLVKQFQKPQPKIAILGLNPHAGENGLLGKEEESILKPVIKQLKTKGMDLTGPISGDTAFTPNVLKQFDAILAMYHDQGLAPIKALYFNQLVNVTLGLPFLRISVDHGTALDKAGTGDISTDSLQAAIQFLQP